MVESSKSSYSLEFVPQGIDNRIEREMQRIDQDTLQQRQTRLAKDADLHRHQAKLESAAQRENRQAMNREYQRQHRQHEIVEQTQRRQAADAEAHSLPQMHRRLIISNEAANFAEDRVAAHNCRIFDIIYISILW